MKPLSTLGNAALTASLLLAVAFAAPPARAIDADEMIADPALEARARDVGKGLRCLVCQNQSIFDSNAGLARDLRDLVRERIRAGDSDSEVLDYIHARYGDYVLLNPPVAGRTAVLWAAPAGFVLIALLLGAVYLRGSGRRRGTVQGQADPDEAELAHARALLAEDKP